MKSFTIVIKQEDIRKPRKPYAPGVKVVKSKKAYNRKKAKQYEQEA